MPFEDKLRQVLDRAEAAHRSALQKQIKIIAKLVADVLRGDQWNRAPGKWYISAKTDKTLSDATRQARESARVLDAIVYLKEKVLHSASACIRDVRLKSDLRAVQDQIVEMFSTGKAPQRGFVYVAWSARPEEYWYVGKASTVERLNLAVHGKLSRATAHVTQLSLIFPSQSKSDILAGTEASVLALIEHCQGRLPDLNQRRERVPQSGGTDELGAMADFLGSIADDLYRE